MKTSVAALIPLAIGAAQAYSGRMTYFYPGLGACGYTNSNSDYVVALSSSDYAAADCGKNIEITCSSGATVTAEVVDKCPGCASGAIDVSPVVFEVCATLDTGVTQVSWNFV